MAISGGGVTASFSYDGLGRRIGKTVNGVATGYVYDGGNFVQEKEGTGATAAVRANLVTGLGLDETFLRMTGSGANLNIAGVLPDANNNTLYTTNRYYSLIDGYSYEPYGAATHVGVDDNSQQYTGRENDGTGLYYYRARHYNPTSGRFLSEDPVEFGAGPNLYAYVGGNPVSFVDPTGELAFLPFLLAGAGSAAFNFTVQMLENYRNSGNLVEDVQRAAKCVNWSGVGAAFAVGTVIPGWLAVTTASWRWMFGSGNFMSLASTALLAGAYGTPMKSGLTDMLPPATIACDCEPPSWSPSKFLY